MKAKKIIVHSGITIEKRCGEQNHPLTECLNAIKLLTENEEIIAYSNSPDFLMAMHYCRPDGCEIHHFLDGKETDLEGVFASLNTALDWINQNGNPTYHKQIWIFRNFLLNYIIERKIKI